MFTVLFVFKKNIRSKMKSKTTSKTVPILDVVFDVVFYVIFYVKFFNRVRLLLKPLFKLGPSLGYSARALTKKRKSFHMMFICAFSDVILGTINYAFFQLIISTKSNFRSNITCCCSRIFYGSLLLVENC